MPSSCDGIRRSIKGAKLGEKLERPRKQGSVQVHCHNKLMEFFTAARIKELLSCDCAHCPPGIPTDETVQEIRGDPSSSRNGGPRTTATYVGVLAFLLIQMMDIRPVFKFMEKGYSDQKLAGSRELDFNPPSESGDKPPISQWTFNILVSGEPDDTEETTADTTEYSNFFNYFIVNLWYEDRYNHRHINENQILPLNIIKEVGKGGYSVVYKARLLKGFHDFEKVQGEGFVAVKTYSDPSLVVAGQDCAKEMLNNSKFLHPRVISLLASLDHKGIFIHIYPFAEGGSLQELFRRNPSGPYLDHHFTWSQFMGLLEGLNHIHTGRADRLGYHFDLKPHNIMIFGDSFWTIIDLGLAHYKEKKEMNADLSKTGRRAGSDEWGPPQWEKVGRGYDVWALGCIGCVILVWLAKGAAGVEQFAKDRKNYDTTHHGVSVIGSSFYGNKVLIPAVETLLSESEAVGGLTGMAAAILRKMLNYEADGRVTANDARVGLQEALEATTPVVPPIPPKFATLTPTYSVTPLQRAGGVKKSLEVPGEAGRAEKRARYSISQGRSPYQMEDIVIPTPAQIGGAEAAVPIVIQVRSPSAEPDLRQRDEAYETSSEAGGDRPAGPA